METPVHASLKMLLGNFLAFNKCPKLAELL